ncbi:MAG TPA: crosslink repair DNA glycosylase YcaQ family protein, partial [Thermoleophilaceae bacterium]|nr:crosslink repair DNA glycosylase YcaQ family protein [Thermoleophilaceae bacterium]
MTTPTITLAALRRHVVAHQGFVTRARRARASEVEAAVRRLSCVQLDSISTVERSHRIVLASRVGVYPRDTVSRLLGEGRVFEYWAHEASLLPIEDFQLFRWRMSGRGHWNSHERALRDHPEVMEHVLAEIRARGPLASRDFAGE